MSNAYRGTRLRRRHGWSAVALSLLLAGCQTLPSHHIGSERIVGAFVSADDQLYMIGSLRTARFDAAPFHAYRQLMDSPLKQAVVCSRLNYRLDVHGTETAKTVQGAYGLLLDADQVSAEQAAAFGLQRVDVADTTDATRLPVRYLKAADPVCDLPVTGGNYYSALYEGNGVWVQLPNIAELKEKSRFATPIDAVLEVNRIPGPMFTPLDAVKGVAGGVVGLAIAPVFLISVPFLGPDHWK